MISNIPVQTPEEGTSFTVNCEIEASNPKPNIIYWTSMKNSDFRADGVALFISNISRAHAGVYICHAENTMIPFSGKGTIGRSERQMTVNVICKCL